MARTTPMHLVELLVLKDDISKVLSYFGRNACFQFQNSLYEAEKKNIDKVNEPFELYKQLEQVCSYLNISFNSEDEIKYDLPSENDFEEIKQIIEKVKAFQKSETEETENNRRLKESYEEALSLVNLAASSEELENASFLTLKVGKINPEDFDKISAALPENAVIIPLGEDKTRVLAACPKDSSDKFDEILSENNFSEIQLPENFKGFSKETVEVMKKQAEDSDAKLSELAGQKNNFAASDSEKIKVLLDKLSVASQIGDIECKLEGTEYVYRLTGWVVSAEFEKIFNDLDELTEKRIAVRKYSPYEVPSVLEKKEKVPSEIRHGKFISSFKRMVFSYGSPVYGTIDPTPFVAVFFTLLFGIMFGDAGQGLVFLILGILMATKTIKFGGWNKFAPIFMAIGCTSMIMGILTGEFFANETLLVPVARFLTGLFGEPRDHILHMMPSSDPHSILNMFKFFGFSVAVGFIINSTGLVLNLINNFKQKKYGKTFFGKNGLSGVLFFWYVIVFVLRVFLFKQTPQMYDWIVIGVTLFFAAFGEPFERLCDGERPVLENGFGSAVIGGVVELIEVVSGYMSNTVSFLRVGAFALAHAVLGYIISTMSALAPFIGEIAILIIGNAIVVVLEGMIVAIQVIRLQYYEFFSKFFNETGDEFKPFAFTKVPAFK